MADYRDISQQYAQGGIKAFTALNAGAAVVALSQASELIKITSVIDLRNAIMLWVVGTALAAFSWIFAFGSTRYVDKSKHETDLAENHLRTSDRYMTAGLAMVALSVVLFLTGCIVLALGLRVSQ